MIKCFTCGTEIVLAKNEKFETVLCCSNCRWKMNEEPKIRVKCANCGRDRWPKPMIYNKCMELYDAFMCLDCVTSLIELQEKTPK